MVTKAFLLLSLFLILQTHATVTPDAVKCCGNEVYSSCNGHCQKTCSDRNPVCKKICTRGCVCQPGYVRNKTGQCIDEKACPSSCEQKEVYSPCSGHCQKTCENKKPICTLICQPGCICRPNYVRDVKTKKCVKENQCPKIKCSVNEVPTNCLPGCPQDTCERVDKKKSVCNTLLPVPCKPGCVCRKNYFRNAEGVCTSAADCLKCRNRNEVLDCRRSCDEKKCSTLNIPCIIVNKKCIKKCYCKKGYARNKWGHCIPIIQCPRIPVKCPNNEEYNCVKPCPPKLCTTNLALIKCSGNQICVHKCDCKAGLLRNKKGKCVKPNQCEKPKCGLNEIYARHRTCPPKTCRSIAERRTCLNSPPCEKKCDCKNKYLRNNKGICVPSNQCFPSKNDKPEVPKSKPYPYNDAPPGSHGTSAAAKVNSSPSVDDNYPPPAFETEGPSPDDNDNATSPAEDNDAPAYETERTSPDDNDNTTPPVDDNNDEDEAQPDNGDDPPEDDKYNDDTYSDDGDDQQ